MFEQLRNAINRLPRRIKSLILAGFDGVALMLVVYASYQLRLGGSFVPGPAQLVLIVSAPLVALPIFLRMGLYRAVIRYLPERAIWTIVWAMALATLGWVFLLFLAAAGRFIEVPRTVPIFYFVLGTAVIGGSRFAAKYLLYLPGRPQYRDPDVLIYGAGESGRQLAAALAEQGMSYVAGFIDDDSSLHGRDVSGIRVYPPARLESLINDFGVKEVIFSMTSVDPARRQAIFGELSRHPVKVRTLPSLREIASGKYSVSQLREVDIDDLLGRSSVPADPELLRRMIAGRAILVSGGGGSIGSELCRIIARLGPAKLVVLEANEFALYQIERQLEAICTTVPVLGSVTDAMLVQRTLREHGVAVVFHAAAHKHVPLVEMNALEGIRNNVFGTQTLVDAADQNGVQDFVLISSDKAVRPSNVMGATKRWSELIVRNYADKAREQNAGRRFSAVRFGNVLGSNGSVVPLFREQIAAGGPVTLTDERMTRYFMSIHEAAELIVQAGALSSGGEIFLLEMGAPVRIRDLAEDMIRLAGLRVRSESQPDGDIEIRVVGARPAEKLFEELFYDETSATRTAQPKILRARLSDAPSRDDLDTELAALAKAVAEQDEAAARRILFGYISS